MAFLPVGNDTAASTAPRLFGQGSPAPAVGLLRFHPTADTQMLLEPADPEQPPTRAAVAAVAPGWWAPPAHGLLVLHAALADLLRSSQVMLLRRSHATLSFTVPGVLTLRLICAARVPSRRSPSSPRRPARPCTCPFGPGGVTVFNSIALIHPGCNQVRRGGTADAAVAAGHAAGLRRRLRRAARPRDAPGVCAHTHLECSKICISHDRSIVTRAHVPRQVHCEPGGCSEPEFCAELDQHRDSREKAFQEVMLLHFDSALALGPGSASTKRLDRCDWGLVATVAGSEVTVEPSARLSFDGTPLYTFIRCFNSDKQGVSSK